MMIAYRWLVCLSCTLLAGCTVYQNARRTLIVEPREHYWKTDREASKAVYRQWAEAAWNQQCASSPGLQLCDSQDYVTGFHDGFSDFVFLGGTGEPPPVPPRRFWNVDCRAQSGRERADQWYSGFRHGAQVARLGGYRELATINSPLCVAPEDVVLSVLSETAPTYGAQPTPMESIPPPAELSPVPSGPPPAELNAVPTGPPPAELNPVPSGPPPADLHPVPSSPPPAQLSPVPPNPFDNLPTPADPPAAILQPAPIGAQ